MSDLWLIHNKMAKDRLSEKKKTLTRNVCFSVLCSVFDLDADIPPYFFSLPRIPCDFIPLNHTEPH